MSSRIVRRVVIVIFVAGIAGMIAGSVADRNGVAITFGLATAVAALALILVTAVTTAPSGPTAEELEAKIQALVDSGTDEAKLRDLVRDAVEMGRNLSARSGARR